MGFRTVVVLSNDQAHEWTNDPGLGRKIMSAASLKLYDKTDVVDRARQELPYGVIVEQVHADTQTVAFLDGYSGEPAARIFWHRGQTVESRNLEMAKELADKFGYRLVKKTVKKSTKN